MSETPDMRAGDELKRSREVLERLGRDLEALRQAGSGAPATRRAAHDGGLDEVLQAPIDPEIDARAIDAASAVERGFESAATAARSPSAPEFMPQDLSETTVEGPALATLPAELPTDGDAGAERPKPAPIRCDASMRQLADLLVQANRLLGATTRLDGGAGDVREWVGVGSLGDDVASAAASLRDAMQRERCWPLGRLLNAGAVAAGNGARAYGGEIEVDREVIERLGGPLVETARAMGSLAEARGPGAPGVEIRAAAQDEMLEIRLRGAGSADRVSAMPSLRALRVATRVLHGAVVVEQTREGAVVRVSVPRCPWFVRALVVSVGTERFALPIGSVGRVVELGQKGRERVVLVPGGAASVVDAARVLGRGDDGERGQAVILSHEGRSVALAVSRVEGAQEIVVRPMDPVPPELGPISGAGAGADGEPLLIADPVRIVELAGVGAADAKVAA